MRRRMGSGMARISTLCPISSFLSSYINYGNALGDWANRGGLWSKISTDQRMRIVCIKRSVLLREEGQFLEDGIHSPDQVLVCVLFCYKPLHAKFLGFIHELSALVHGENNNRCFRRELPDQASCVQAVQFRHRDVQNDQVWF